MFTIRTIVLLFCFAYGAQSANILGITTLLSHSHHLWHEFLVARLVENGHNVTLVSHDPMKKKLQNYTVLEIKGVYEQVQDLMDLEAFVDADVQLNVKDFWDYMAMTCNMDIQSDAVKTLLNYPKDYKFDLVIWDMSSGECLLPFVKRFGNPPIVGTSPFGIQPYLTNSMGGHIFNYIPFCLSYPTDKVDFWKRLENTITIADMIYTREYDYLPKMRKLSQGVFGEDMEDFKAVERRISLALVNTDHVLDFPQYLPPNVIAVGGLQAIKPKPLPNDLKKILDNAKQGAIYFSLGSNVRPEKMGEKFFDAFNGCFSKLPYTVLWKLNDNTRTFPKNVHVRNWMPQNDILAHPNVKLFISHGGALSTQESMSHGVPVVGLPVFLDQIQNIQKLVIRGIGQQLSFKHLSEESVCATIKEVINNKSYKQKMELIAARHNDQQNTPLDRAIYWIEYVLRHGTAEHLSVAARDMTFIENLNLDIIFLLYLVITLPIFLVLLCCCRRGKSEGNKKVKTK